MISCFNTVVKPTEMNLYQAPIISLALPHEDERGYIQTLVDGDIQAVQLITSAKGSVRANHYHKFDSHYMFILSGCARYIYREVGADESPRFIFLDKYQLVYTPPMVEHAVEYLEDTVFLNITTRSREKEVYENDIIRVDLFKPFQSK